MNQCQTRFFASVLAATLGLSLVGCRTKPLAFSKGTSGWITVTGDKSSRDSRVLNAAIQDVLSDSQLGNTMSFYGEPNDRTVRYALGAWPSGYTPKVRDYEFEAVRWPQVYPGNEPKHLTIGLSALWLDGQPPSDNWFSLVFSSHLKPPNKGLVLYVTNTGGGTIGGCSVGYEVEEIPGGWKLRYAGHIDP